MDALAATGGCDTGAAIGEGLVAWLVWEKETVKWREGCREWFNTRRGVATYPVVGASGPIHPPGLQPQHGSTTYYDYELRFRSARNRHSHTCPCQGLQFFDLDADPTSQRDRIGQPIAKTWDRKQGSV